MSATDYPHRIQPVHIESIEGELCVYDTVRQRVHSLNQTAAFVWQRCDGRTAPAELATALSAEASIDDAEAVVQLTLQELAAAQLLVAPVSEVARVSRRDLLRRGVSAAAIPAIYSIMAPSPAAAQSPPPAAAPTLTSVAPNQGTQGTTVAVTLTGTNFVVGATTVAVSGAGVTVNTVVVSSSTSLTANFVLGPTAAPGGRAVTVETAGGTSGPQTFTVNAPPPTLTSVAPNQGIRGETVAVTLTGINFIVGATTVNVAGGSDVTVNTVVVGSSTSLTANFVLALASPGGARTVTVTTAGGTSGGQTFTITLPAPGSTSFAFTGSSATFTVPAGVGSITILATGAGGGAGSNPADGVAGLGGRTTATVPVTPGASLTVVVGGAGMFGIGGGGFNGGGVSTGFGGGGGGASSVRNGATPLVVVGGAGGGAAGETGEPVGGGNGGAGGGLSADPGTSPPLGGTGGGGGTQAAGGAGGTGGEIAVGSAGTAGGPDTGGTGGRAASGVIGGGGGGGGYFGGGGGGCGNENDAGGGGGGGGSSFAAPGATAVLHEKGVNSGAGSVTISW